MHLYRKLSKEYSNGQILVMMAIMFIFIVAIVGLAIDLGFWFIGYSRLRRAVDAAALGAATQFKKNSTDEQLQKAAREYLVLNGVPDTESLAAFVDTCDSTKADLTRFPGGNGDPALCLTPPRKVVRVSAREDVPLYFLAIMGLHSAPVSVYSISEAATVDVILVIDRSESMGIYKPDLVHQYPAGSQNGDPAFCNSGHPNSTWIDQSAGGDNSLPSDWTGDCHPFGEVKGAAVSFINEFMDPGYDRVAVVVFDNQSRRVNFGTEASPLYMTGDPEQAKAAIRGLWMFDGFKDSGNGLDVRSATMDPGTYSTHKGPVCTYTYPDNPDPTIMDPTQLNEWLHGCRALDLNNGFYEIDYAGMYPDATNPYYKTSVNMSYAGNTNIGAGLYEASSILQAFGRPDSLWVTVLLTDGVPNAGYDKDWKPICPISERSKQPFCRNADPTVRHTFDPANDTLYDTVDYARDQADSLANDTKSVIFAIGLGPEVTKIGSWQPAGTDPAGATLLNYIAATGLTTSYYQAKPDELQKVFLAIANKIATRLNK